MNNGRTQRVILLVEDDPADQTMVQRALEDSSIQSRLMIANDGAEALDYLERKGDFADAASSPLPDLMLLDLNMPRVPGREVVRSMRADPRFQNLPVVVLSTSKDPRDVADSYALGANSYVVKPSGLDELTRMLQAVQEYWFRTVELPDAA